MKCWVLLLHRIHTHYCSTIKVCDQSSGVKVMWSLQQHTWCWKKYILLGRSARVERAGDPQWATIMSHRMACYSKGAELAGRSAADTHLFWHFLSTLTQKTHDNATLCISKAQGVWWSPFTSPFLVPLIPKTTFHSMVGEKSMTHSHKNREAWARHVVTINKHRK